ncbi:hypothetical protein PCASD_09609 [Puccinia coronata f. sp. avenae]|uniref:Uncharacterized protein n=1 Tax=Puccinia coronata f. sp. avenae TaxID=200324 RepID=A0A2N5UPM3_9BASI|nr:hypothetical protein PCASD_09609 [Puccinia coronata f. sp. avenae]
MQEPSNAKLEVPGSTPGASATHSQTPSVDPPHRTPTSNNSSTGAATQESIRIMVATQKASIVQSQADQEASALRMSRIKEAILLLSMKTKQLPPPHRINPSRVAT